MTRKRLPKSFSEPGQRISCVAGCSTKLKFETPVLQKKIDYFDYSENLAGTIWLINLSFSCVPRSMGLPFQSIQSTFSFKNRMFLKGSTYVVEFFRSNFPFRMSATPHWFRVLSNISDTPKNNRGWSACVVNVILELLTVLNKTLPFSVTKFS